MKKASDRTGSIAGHLLRIVMPLLVLAIGFAVARHFIVNKPAVKKRPPRAMETLVEVIKITPVSTNVQIEAMGTLTPVRELVLRSRVGGEVIDSAAAFEEGGRLAKGDTILRIDPTDHEIALDRARAQAAQAEANVQLESGRQLVARRELTLMGADEDMTDEQRSLALREPYLAQVQAAARAAAAAVRDAELDVERTAVRAPFNALIRTRHVQTGSQVTPQEPLAELVGTDFGWVRLSVPYDRLRWIEVPRAATDVGAAVRIARHGGEGPSASVEGKVVRMLGDLEARGRMATLLVEIADPLAALDPTREPLLFGTYLRATIEGKVIHEVLPVPRPALRDQDRLWVVTADGTFGVREATVIWRGPDTVLVRGGLEAGDRLIVSDIATPIPGMPLRVRGENGPPRGPSE